MSRPIDADALRQTFQRWANVPEYNNAERHIIRGAMIAVDDCPTIGGWISVKDRLPEDGFIGKLIYDPENGARICLKVDEITLKSGKTIYTDAVDILDFLRPESITNIENMTHITHWMPLPGLPKEDDDDSEE